MVKKQVPFTRDEEFTVKQRVTKLMQNTGTLETKYQRNINRYYNNGKGVVDSIHTLNTTAQGYQQTYSAKAGLQTSINVLKSAVDTICSKISQAKVRPFFNSVNGDYSTLMACRTAQVFFDRFFEDQSIYKQAPEVMRDACIFDTGMFYVNEDAQEVQQVLPFNVAFDTSEYHYGGIRSCTHGVISMREYPKSFIYRDLGKDIDKVIKTGNTSGYYQIFFDIPNKRKYHSWDGVIFACYEIDYTRLPFVPLFWTIPVKGKNTTSLIDEGYTIQCNIDELQARIDEATRANMFNTVYIGGGDIKESKLTNDAGLIVKFNPSPTGGQPVVSTPPAISNQYIELLNLYINKIYELAGISAIGAQGKVPSNVKSAVMMETMESLQSDRHNITLQNYIRMFTELTEVCIDVFPEDADILPKSNAHKGIKWKDIKKARESYQIQFSAGSALSKDPSTKIEQIQQMQAIGIDVKDILPTLLEIPDLEKAYSVNTASYDYVQSIIQKTCDDGNIDFVPIVDLQMLYREAVRWMLRLSADEGNQKYLVNLKQLIDKVEKIQNDTAVSEVPEEPTAPIVPPIM